MRGAAFVALAQRVERHIGQAHRYAHTVRVARFADRLAQAHDEDAGRARLAGLLHDLARLYANERLIAECSARNMAIDDFERAHPIVLHARLGAEIARDDFGIGDEAVLSAIRHHTVARPGMSRLDWIVYLADSLEPGRAYPERARFAALAMDDLQAACRVVVESSIEYLRSRGNAVAPQTLAALAGLTSVEERQPA